MRFSLFTPTHNGRYLGELYASLSAQIFQDWEWVIVPNGKQQIEIDATVLKDPRVRIVPAPDWMGPLGVGALKRFACDNCQGEYFVEMDHDDLLTPDALLKVDQAARETGAGFLYSDFANFRGDGSCEVYGAEFGWQSYPVHVYGRDYIAMRAFGPTASSLAQIYYAPNHIRVWSRQAYYLTGGHDATLPVVDDHDLVCRTYLAGVKFHHIPECLYLYRLQADGNNTYVQRNAEIQTRQREISNRYIYRLIAEWCRRENLRMLDLGGGHNKPEGYQSVDLHNGDITHDIRQGLPFADNSVGCIRAYDFLEHVPTCGRSDCPHTPPLCTVGLMNEIYRVLAPGGWLVSRTPSTEGRGAFQDPTHASFWNPNSFWYYTRREQANFVAGIQCRFQGNRIWQDFPSDWHRQHNILYVFADLVALKGQPQPGICEI